MTRAETRFLASVNLEIISFRGVKSRDTFRRWLEITNDPARVRLATPDIVDVETPQFEDPAALRIYTVRGKDYGDWYCKMV